jgi:hypothetical protein
LFEPEDFAPVLSVLALAEFFGGFSRLCGFDHFLSGEIALAFKLREASARFAFLLFEARDVSGADGYLMRFRFACAHEFRISARRLGLLTLNISQAFDRFGDGALFLGQLALGAFAKRQA